MGKINNSADPFVKADKSLHPSRNFYGFKGLLHEADRYFVDISCGNSRHCIFHIKFSFHFQGKALGKTIAADPETCTPVLGTDITVTDICIRMFSKSYHPFRFSCSIFYSFHMVRIQIDAYCFTLPEHRKLRTKIILKIFMFRWADMVFCDV